MYVDLEYLGEEYDVDSDVGSDEDEEKLEWLANAAERKAYYER